MKRVVAAFALVAVIAVLGYGYWFGVTHGSLYMSVLDASDREHLRDVTEGELIFLNAQGDVLAKAARTERSGAFLISSPAVYTCSEIEQRAAFSLDAREEWASCFERQSRWLPTWVREVRSVDIGVNSCTIHKSPASISEHPDTWWLWWVPLRHIGGKPYTSFNFQILINPDSCRVAG